MEFVSKTLGCLFRSSIFAVLLGLSCAAHADIFRPAYLELREAGRAIDGADRYEVLWKVPVMGDTRLAVQIRFPAGTTQLSSPQGLLGEDAYVERWKISRRGGLAGQTLRIDGIAGGVTDVIVRIERQDGTSQVERLLLQSPEFTIKSTTGTAEVAGSYLILGVQHILG